MNKKINFSGRRRARRYALQALYAWEVAQNALSQIEVDILSEHKEGELDVEYFQQLLHNIPQQISQLDAIFEPHLSRKLEDLGLIELTLLRIAVYELKDKKDVPYRVVINESLELAKIFGATDSHKFVNGVLDKVVQDFSLK